MFLIFIVDFILSLISMVYLSFIFKNLWLWFIVPVFNLPPVTLVSAIGVIIVISIVTYKKSTYKETKEIMEEGVEKEMIYSFTYDILTGTYLFILGWFIKEWLF